MLGAFGKGAPVRVIGNSIDGANDLYWYVPANSPVHSPADAAGKSIGYSTTGSSTDLVVRGLQRVFKVTMAPGATGSPPATFTQVMSGQVDIGWASPPFGVEAVQSGRTRIVARGSDVPEFATQSVRVMIANASALSSKADAMARYMAAYRETIEWMYSDPAALDAYGKWAGVTPELAKQVRDQFYPRQNLDPDRASLGPGIVVHGRGGAQIFGGAAAAGSADGAGAAAWRRALTSDAVSLQRRRVEQFLRRQQARRQAFGVVPPEKSAPARGGWLAGRRTRNPRPSVFARRPTAPRRREA